MVMKTKELIKAARRLSKPFCITDGSKFRLKDIDPGDTLDLKDEDKERAGDVSGGRQPTDCTRPGPEAG